MRTKQRTIGRAKSSSPLTSALGTSMDKSKGNKTRPKICPSCDNTVSISEKQAINYVIFYKPFRCDKCNQYFELSHLTKFIFIIMGIGIIVSGIKFETILELEKQQPYLRTYIIASVFLLSIVVAFILSKTKEFTVVPQHRVLATLFHYTFIILPIFSLGLFVYLQKIYST